MKHAVIEPHETYFVLKQERGQWIEDYVECEMFVARTRVGNPDKAMKQEQDDTGNTENTGLTTSEPEKFFSRNIK